MSASTVRAATITDAITSKWRGRTAITVVANPSDLPITAPDDARGLYKGGATWIVANTQPTWQVAQTLVHEMLGHHSMRKALGTGWRPFMHAIQAGLRSGDPQLKVARGMVRSAYVDDSGAFNLSAIGESDEIVALAAELGFNAEAGRMGIAQPARKMVIAAAGQFAREQLYMEHPAKFADVEGMLLTAEHHLRHGGPVWGLGFKFRRWYASAMTKPWDPNQPPMSLRESENLLRASREAEQAAIGWKIFGSIVAAVVLLGAFFYFAVTVFGSIGKFFGL